MRSSHRLWVTAGLSFLILSGCDKKAEKERGTDMPETTAKAPDVEGEVDPRAVEALKKMSAYLMTLKTAGVTSNGSLDVVTEEGQRIQLDGVAKYKIRKPNGFVIEFKSNQKERTFFYDGKNFTVYAPIQGFYAQVPAPATNKETLAMIYDKFGLELPLEDLFRWGEPGSTREEQLKSAFPIGTAMIDGVLTNHFAFREGDADWEVWIDAGDKPLPRKLVIVDRTDEARPTFTARLAWQENPTFSDSDFTFKPDENAKRIQMARYDLKGKVR